MKKEKVKVKKPLSTSVKVTIKRKDGSEEIIEK